MYIYTTVGNKERKSGALNQGYRLYFGDLKRSNVAVSEDHKKAVSNIVAYVGADADIILERKALFTLYKEMSSNYQIGAVSANYTCVRPSRGPIKKFLTSLQSKDFTSWTIRQKIDGYKAEISGGQTSMFRPQALKDVFDKTRLNGIYDSSTATEDLELSNQLRKVGWKTVISRNARCYVGAMTTMKSLYHQRLKWTDGKLQYQTSTFSHESLKMWGQELLLLMNLLIRVALITLIPASIALDMFRWNWLWITPIVISGVLNFIVTIKTPKHTPIELLLSLTGIPAELWIWFEIRVHLSVWISRFKIDRGDMWLAQEQAENNTLSRNWSGIIGILMIGMAIALLYTTGLVTLNSTAELIKPYITTGYEILTFMTIITTLLMLKELWKFRGNHRG